MDERYPNTYDEFETPQGNLPEDDDGAIAVACVLSIIGGFFLALGLFIGWMIFAPQGLAASECGSVEACMVRAEQ